jgi:hypothetical protein
MKQFNNNNNNNKNCSFKKPRDHILRSRLDCTGFNKPRRDMLRERTQGGDREGESCQGG